MCTTHSLEEPMVSDLWHPDEDRHRSKRVRRHAVVHEGIDRYQLNGPASKLAFDFACFVATILHEILGFLYER